MSDKESLSTKCPHAKDLSLSDRAVLLKLALEMIDRESQFAGDEYVGTATARRLCDSGHLMEVNKFSVGPVGYVFTMLGNAAVGEMARLVHKITGIGDT